MSNWFMEFHLHKMHKLLCIFWFWCLCGLWHNLKPHDCWDRRFESCWGHGFLSLVKNLFVNFQTTFHLHKFLPLTNQLLTVPSFLSQTNSFCCLFSPTINYQIFLNAQDAMAYPSSRIAVSHTILNITCWISTNHFCFWNFKHGYGCQRFTAWQFWFWWPSNPNSEEFIYFLNI